MNLDKYTELRNKIINQDFETKNKDIDKWLNVFSYVGNIGSIFFAFFLVYPALYKAISTNIIDTDISTYLASIITIIILSCFELLKRKVLSNLSFDIVKNKFKIGRALIGWLIFSILILLASFYFSINGAINFANTSNKKNVLIENNTEIKIDSISNIYNDRITTLINDNDGYRESNIQYRDKIASTPLNYRKVRNDYQNQINTNNSIIIENDNRINSLKLELKDLIDDIQSNSNDVKNNNIESDTNIIVLFFILSFSIEVIIILGIWFDKYYQYKVYLLKSVELESKYKKRDRYKTLIKFIYKEGDVGIDKQIMGKTKILSLIKDNTTIQSPTKFVNDFFDDMEYLNIFKLVGKRRYTVLSYSEALNKINLLEDKFKLIDDLN